MFEELANGWSMSLVWQKEMVETVANCKVYLWLDTNSKIVEILWRLKKPSQVLDSNYRTYFINVRLLILDSYICTLVDIGIEWSQTNHRGIKRLLSNFFEFFVNSRYWSSVWGTKIFPHYVGCLFTLLVVSFAMQKLINLIQSHLLVLGIIFLSFFSVEIVIAYVYVAKNFTCFIC